MPGMIDGVVQDFRTRALAFLTLFVVAYWFPLKSIVHTWTSNDDYSYGFIIPVISAYLLWEKRSYLRNARIESSWRIFPLLVAAVLLSLYGILGSSGNISLPTVPLLFILFSAFIFGVELVRNLMLPLGFLFFMVPVPATIERSLGMFLKSVSTKLGGGVISFCDIPVHVSGNVIDLGTTQLQVVDACSGMRFLFPLLAIGVLYAHFFERAMWKRVFCVVATLPIAVFNNGLRIGITGILTNYFGKEAAEGFFHDFEGWAMFMVAFALLYLLGRVLRFLPPAHHQAPCAEPGRVGGEVEPAAAPPSANRAFYTSMLILVLVGGVSFSTGALPAVKIKGGIAGFPLSFAGWEGRSEFVDPKIVAASGAEESFSGQYVNGKAQPVSLYLGYRSTAFLENENFFHSPTVCLPSAGWEVVRTTTRKIANVPGFGELPVTEMLMESMGARYLVFYWFQTKSRVTHDRETNRFHLALHALERDNTYDLFIRPITRIAPDERPADAEARMDVFARDMTVALHNFLAERIR